MDQKAEGEASADRVIGKADAINRWRVKIGCGDPFRGSATVNDATIFAVMVAQNAFIEASFESSYESFFGRHEDLFAYVVGATNALQAIDMANKGLVVSEPPVAALLRKQGLLRTFRGCRLR